VISGVSRQHARLVLVNSAWAIEDLHSTNGTSVNHEPLPPFQPLPLRDGDQVDLGQMSLVFHTGDSR
jgi:3',5'-cyclic-nucleotide phosphodiesterase